MRTETTPGLSSAHLSTVTKPDILTSTVLSRRTLLGAALGTAAAMMAERGIWADQNDGYRVPPLGAEPPRIPIEESAPTYRGLFLLERPHSRKPTDKIHLTVQEVGFRDQPDGIASIDTRANWIYIQKSVWGASLFWNHFFGFDVTCRFRTERNIQDSYTKFPIDRLMHDVPIRDPSDLKEDAFNILMYVPTFDRNKPLPQDVDQRRWGIRGDLLYDGKIIIQSTNFNQSQEYITRSPHFIAHEIGHCCGIPHNDEAQSIMNDSFSLEQGHIKRCFWPKDKDELDKVDRIEFTQRQMR